MIPEGTDASAITEDQARQVAHHVEQYIKKTPGMTRLLVARAIGAKSAGTISDVLQMKYKGDWRNMIRRLDAWLEAEIKAKDTPTTGRFVLTSVADEIMTVANLMVQTRKIGLVYGPDTSGIGKTMALQAIHQETPGSIFMTCDKVEANPTGLLRAIAYGMRMGPGRSNRWLYAEIKRELKGTRRLLIIDQIHNLRGAKDDRPLYILTDLWDATGAPQLWCGTADMKAYLNRHKRGDESLAQVSRRIVYSRDLMQRCRPTNEGGRGEPLVTLDDVRKVFARNKLRLTDDGAQFLYRLCQVPNSGALGTAANLVLIATIIADQNGRDAIDAKLLQASLRDSVRHDTFQTLHDDLIRDDVQLRMAIG